MGIQEDIYTRLGYDTSKSLSEVIDKNYEMIENKEEWSRFYMIALGFARQYRDLNDNLASTIMQNLDDNWKGPENKRDWSCIRDMTVDLLYQVAKEHNFADDIVKDFPAVFAK